MDYNKLIKALLCDGYGIGQNSDGCSNKKCKYRDTDGACNIVSMCGDAAAAITDLLDRAEAAEHRLQEAEAQKDYCRKKCDVSDKNYQIEMERRKAAEARAKKAERERDAAVADINTLLKQDEMLPCFACARSKGGISVERLTYDFCVNGIHCWQVKGADNSTCEDVCKDQGEDGCAQCPINKAIYRLAQIENILGDEYDLDRFKEIMEAEKNGQVDR